MPIALDRAPDSATVMMLARTHDLMVSPLAPKKFLPSLRKKVLLSLAPKPQIGAFFAARRPLRSDGRLENTHIQERIEATRAVATPSGAGRGDQGQGGDAIVQTANVTGERNVTTQIAGSGNVVQR